MATAAIPGKTLVITGVKIDTFNTVAAVATTATVLQWSIGVGGTAVTLLTVDSVTAGTRAARRLGLGVQNMIVGTPVGGMATPTIDTKFTSPLMVEPGSYCHIILKMPIATATAIATAAPIAEGLKYGKFNYRWRPPVQYSVPSRIVRCFPCQLPRRAGRTSSDDHGDALAHQPGDE